jgi:2Fe-2S ferredoxin
MFSIKISFEGGEKPRVIEKVRSGETILGVCLNHNILLRHDCGGIGACSTCHVHIFKGGSHLEEAGQREKDLLAKAIRCGDHSRLACQCVIVDKKGDIDVLIPRSSISISEFKDVS